MDIDNPTISARAPSYALESDSDDSDWDFDAPAEQRSKPRTPDAKVEMVGAVDAGRDVVFLVGEAGERLSLGVKVEGDGAHVLVDGEQAATIRTSSGSAATVVFISSALPLASLYPLVSTILAALSPRSATIIASYHSPSYLTATPFSSAPILYLRSTPSDALASLKSSGIIHPFSPPNLIHGLAASLLTLSALSEAPSTLILVPTVAAPQPLNGPFPSTTSWTNRNTAYDAGGPTGLSDPDGSYKELKGTLKTIKNALEWSWWNPDEAKGNGFAWIEAQRKARRKAQTSGMYM
ncbi:hypothetical protein P7C70_g756, partial [Phenoliferia sp. Uapishka_3]